MKFAKTSKVSAAVAAITNPASDTITEYQKKVNAPILANERTRSHRLFQKLPL